MPTHAPMTPATGTGGPMSEPASQADRFHAKVAVVTGGMNGMGRACAVRLRADGVGVVVVDVLSAAAGGVVDLIHDGGGQAVAVVGDLRDPRTSGAAVAADLRCGGGRGRHALRRPGYRRHRRGHSDGALQEP
jgi:hypothetical protein